MPMTKKKGKKGSSTKDPSRISENALSYVGPSRPLKIAREQQVTTSLLHEARTLASNGSGVIAATAVYSNPSTAANWGHMSNAYDEFRVLACRLKYVPFNGYNKVVATQSCLPLYVALDRDSAGTPAAVTDITDCDSATIFDSERVWSIDEYRMNGSRESQFATTGAPNNLGAYLIFGNSFTASLNYGELLITWLVQFRGAN